jgi:hypothetical protein
MIKSLLAIALSLAMQSPILAQSGQYKSNVDAVFEKAMQQVQQGHYDDAIILYRRAYEEGLHHCDQGFGLAGMAAAKAAKAKLKSMPNHPHRGQAADAEFWAVYEKESMKLPGECLA